MIDRELKKLNRMELINIIYEVEKENEELKSENEELNNKLKERTILIDEAGSIANASLALTEIFEKAQEAADLYLDNVRALSERETSKRKQKRKGKRKSNHSSADSDIIEDSGSATE